MAQNQDSGAIMRASFAIFDPDTYSWKTSQTSLFEDSTASSPTWPLSGSMRSGRVSARATSEPPISDDDFFCSRGDPKIRWPTPTGSDALNSRKHGYIDGGNTGTTLTDAMLGFYGEGSPQAFRKGERGRVTKPTRVLNPAFCEALMGLPPQMDVARTSDRLRAIGNAVIPRQAARAFALLTARAGLDHLAVHPIPPTLEAA